MQRMNRIEDFRRRLQRAAADRTFELPNGTAIVSDSVPDVYDANYLSVESAGNSAAALAADAEAALETSHHRRVIVEDGSAGVAEDFAELGFDRVTHLVLAHTAEPDRRVDASAIRPIELDALIALRTDATLREPWGDADIAAQLNAAKRLVAAAVPTRFFAAEVDGAIAGWCELRHQDGVAQIEDVEVLEEFRGRGLGRAIVQHALGEGLRAGELVYLEALADDWPRELYAKLGFTVVGRRDVYTRLPGPLTRLRLRTPRLELRVPTRAEARRLFTVAAAGIHDPDVMPFEFPWTDNLDESDFVAYSTASTADAIRFTAFHDGAPIGVQGLDFHPSYVTTGSWLGRTSQGRGFGTEMRAAVLTYAFGIRDATIARSGAIAGNAQSLGVSRKLGYEAVGSHVVSPRGEAVEHTDVELRRDRFRSPVPVSVDGVRPLA
ncbi:MAG TPA: GNAT family N-acetyltransferase [Gaiellaceae bacterium]|jgi:RimJ/RimL family protein N-acetyltransferase/predicted GNAT family acetyltransferase